MVAHINTVIFQGVIFSLFLVFSFPVLASGEKYTESRGFEAISPAMLRALGGAMSEDKQKFEETIKDLLFITVNDLNINFTTRKIDMQERKRFFNEEAWGEYQGYVLDRKSKLRLLQKDSEDQTKEKADFVYGSQNYIEQDGSNNFSADYTLCYGRYDNYTCKPDKLHIDLSYKGDFVTPENIVIERWSIKSGAKKN